MRIDDRRHSVVWLDLQEFRRKLPAPSDIDVLDLIENAQFLEHDADLPTIRCGPVIKLNRCRDEKSPLGTKEISSGGHASSLPAS